MIWTPDTVRAAFARLNTWSQNGVRAPHKPLLALYALARVLTNAPRLLPFIQAEPILSHLLLRFGPPQSQPRPHYPFWRLQRDHLWEIPESQQVIDAGLTSGGDARLAALRHTHGGFPTELHAMLAANPLLVVELIDYLIDAHFPTSYRDDLMNAIGLPAATLDTSMLAERTAIALRYALGRPRTPTFRALLLRAFAGRCAMCGFDAVLDGQPLAIEAAHIRWHAANGPDTPDNGLLLCVLHHHAFDRGALGLDPQRRIRVASSLRGGIAVHTHLAALDGQPLVIALDIPPPARQFIDWHTQQVFRG